MMTICVPWPLMWALAGLVALGLLAVIEMDRLALGLKQWVVFAFFVALWPLGLVLWGVGHSYGRARKE